ncbi:MAG: phage portal protein [Acidobacteriota bacterium]|nr:phage portal protein [Acidobacteriota bacterium]
MFPEITSRLKGLLDGFGSKPVSLDLKAAGGFSFDAVNVGGYARNGYPGLYSILSGGMPAWSGEVVSLETALNHSVVWACTRIISESTGFIPLVMVQQKNGVKNPALDHPMFSAMRNAPSDEMTAMTFRETLTSHCLLQGNAYAQIFRRAVTDWHTDFWAQVAAAGPTGVASFSIELTNPPTIQGAALSTRSGSPTVQRSRRIQASAG